MKIDVKIKSTEEKSYPIIINSGSLSYLKEYLNKYTTSKKFLVVTNKTIYRLYKDFLKNFDVLVLKDGERYKTIETFNKVIDKAIELKLERNDCFVAFGGGVIGDLTGFCAASYLRGINFVQVPTTLLAMVDSSVGGKVAVNSPKGKNLIGAFYQPKLVLADINTLKTLPVKELKSGLGEILKYAFIEKSCNANVFYELFDFLRKSRNEIYLLEEETLKTLISICCKLKAAVVNQDEKEKGLRAILNLGHTFGHAIETITNYKKYTHGEAVAIGIKMAFEKSLSLDKISKEYFDSAMELLELFELSTSLKKQISEKKIYEIMKSDKKVKDGKIKFVVPKSNYSVEIVDE